MMTPAKTLFAFFYVCMVLDFTRLNEVNYLRSKWIWALSKISIFDSLSSQSSKNIKPILLCFEQFYCNLPHRSSRSEEFCKIYVLRNLVQFTGKHLCQSLFLNKVSGLRPATLLTLFRMGVAKSPPTILSPVTF